MKQKILQLSAILLCLSGLFTACAEEELSTRQPDIECPEQLAELITADVERFHRLGIAHIVKEMQLHPGSDLFNMRFEQVMGLMGHNINDYAETFDWNFEPDLKGLQITRDAIDLFTALSGQETKNWLDAMVKQLKSNDEYENDLVNFDKIAMFSQKIGEIITTDSKKGCPDEHLDFIQEKLDELMSNATNQLNEYEVFIVNNNASVGLSSIGSWQQIISQWTDHKESGGTIDWKLVGEIAEADAVAGVLACMGNSNAIVAASVLGGWGGFLASAGSIFAKSSVAFSAGYYYWILREDEDDPENIKLKIQ